MHESDQELIKGCRQGHADTWDRLVRKYERLVFSIPLNYGISYDEAADITQITFTILLQSLDSLKDDSHLGSWLATVAKRHTWRLLEHGRRESTNNDEDLSESINWLVDETSSQVMERWELTEWLHQGLALMDERCRRLLLALYLEPEPASYAEVATELNIPVGSIGPTRARCLERLKALLNESLLSE